MNINYEINSIKWWDEKNEGKDKSLEYDLDFEHEIVEHIAHGEILEVHQDDS